MEQIDSNPNPSFNPATNKKTFYCIITSLLFLGSLCFSVQWATAQETAANPASANQQSITVATVDIYNMKIISQTGNKFDISFNLSNGIIAQPEVKYVVSLIKEDQQAQTIVDEKIYPEILNLEKNQILLKEITYEAPLNLYGTFQLRLSAQDARGRMIAINSLGKVILNSIENPVVSSNNLIKKYVPYGALALAIIIGLIALFKRRRSIAIPLLFLVMIGGFLLNNNVAEAIRIDIPTNQTTAYALVSLDKSTYEPGGTITMSWYYWLDGDEGAALWGNIDENEADVWLSESYTEPRSGTEYFTAPTVPGAHTFFATASCCDGERDNGTINFTVAAPMSGTLTASDCTIASGHSSCDTTLAWTTTSPVATSAVTTPTDIYVATGNTGSTTYSVDYGNRTFYLYNNMVLLYQATATATCASGSTWNESSCVTPTKDCTLVQGTLSGFGACSTTACGATGTQTRTCDGASCGGDCNGQALSQTCYGPAPIDATLGGWGDCSATCGPGTETRTCSGANSCGDATCGGAALSRNCNLGDCPPDCTPIRDATLSNWNDCFPICGELSTRSRTCGGASCGGTTDCVGALWQYCSYVPCDGCTEPDNNCEIDTCTTDECWNGCELVDGTKDCGGCYIGCNTSIICPDQTCYDGCGWVAGTKDCSCTNTSWLPDPSTVCSGTPFTQTGSPCGGTRSATGTKCCGSCGSTSLRCSNETWSDGCEGTCTGTKCCCDATRAPLVCEDDHYKDSCDNNVCPGTMEPTYGPWTLCNKTCGGGTRTKQGFCTPSLTETCNTKPCPPGYKEVTPW